MRRESRVESDDGLVLLAMRPGSGHGLPVHGLLTARALPARGLFAECALAVRWLCAGCVMAV